MTQQQGSILVGSLGASWAVVPEIYGWLAPAVLDLYAHHPQRDVLRREVQDLAAPRTLHLVTTAGIQADEAIRSLRQWWAGLAAPGELHVWQAEDTDQLGNPKECARLRELTFRVVLHASHEAARIDEPLVLSLAGGRKTMSADLQAAAQFFGCAALLHVVDTRRLPPDLLRPAPEQLTQPLAANLADALRPLRIGQTKPSELLALESGISLENYPLSAALENASTASSSFHLHRWKAPPNPALWNELDRRSRESQQLLGNFLADLQREETHENWRSLYRLPPERLQKLRDTVLTPADRDTLVAWPKAELHRHIGGSLSLAQQSEVASAIWADASLLEKTTAQRTVAPLLTAAGENRDWEWTWPKNLQDIDIKMNIFAKKRAVAASALLLQCPLAFLQRQLFGATEPRVALKSRHQYGFAAYERPGELTGSAVLAHPAALAPYAQALVASARAEGLLYVELRGSPHKYRPQDPAGFLADLRDALQAAGAATSDQPENEIFAHLENDPGAPLFGFLWILDRRHTPEQTGRIVEQAARAREPLGAFLLGLDLAGDESGRPPDELAPCFVPAFKACLPITIHAGEGEAAENIWQAAYQLHADRIGHGLTLADNLPLAQRFRDRGILLELCPTSNREVIGFRDPIDPATQDQPIYPLATLLEQGIPLTLCTDNPGISRTTLADEYLTASRMLEAATQAPLSHWQALALIHQAFTHAFLPAGIRNRLRKLADRRIHAQIRQASATPRA